MLFSTDVISTRQLDLVLLSPEFLRLSTAGDHDAAERLLGLSIPLDWYERHALIELHLGQLRNGLDYHPWSLRGISLRAQSVMVGYISFHTKPGAAYLQNYAANGVEFGYTIFPPHRRHGYAREACEGLMK